MKNLKFITLALTILFATACKDKPKNTDKVTKTEAAKETSISQKSLSIALDPKSGSNVEGTIKFSEENGTVSMVGTITGLEEGKHAIHIHEKADCSANDGTSSGGHWNPTAQPHGAWGDEAGYHKGDIGNLTANSDGKATITKTTDEWCIGCEDDTKNILGKAVIVHIGVDDLKSQPSGDAGTRIGCAGIIK
ncbi:superoxide dismutase family protein [Winogradskyella undariae]|uniref:superoxide dismutase family protein n=1 Tax=Winogradskyella undariae TaxID=1285465 RepID=UPI00156B11CA|nr:superoxide dismutase family protein [Winogradskyella undariae]NRR91904.1 superoxide dismutase family protein [Winogradskyella undariae]